MRAAVQHQLATTPRYEEFSDPIPVVGEVLVGSKAAPLINLSESRARGRKRLPNVWREEP